MTDNLFINNRKYVYNFKAVDKPLRPYKSINKVRE
jgi:hypothetical protein